jgi:hypothetical protein
MKTNKTIVRMAALSALVTLTACHTSNSPRSANDPWQTYKLGTVYNCEDIAVPDMRHNTENTPTPGFGCAHQSNMTLMAADPADLNTPRAMSPSDPFRSQRVLDAYREGQDTTSAKRAEGTQALIQ